MLPYIPVCVSVCVCVSILYFCHNPLNSVKRLPGKAVLPKMFHNVVFVMSSRLESVRSVISGDTCSLTLGCRIIDFSVSFMLCVCSSTRPAHYLPIRGAHSTFFFSAGRCRGVPLTFHEPDIKRVQSGTEKYWDCALLIELPTPPPFPSGNVSVPAGLLAISQSELVVSKEG